MRSNKRLPPVPSRDTGALENCAVTAVTLVGLLLLLGACTRTTQAPTATGSSDIPVSALAITQTKLLASDRVSNDEFGYAVAISGNTAVVGARYDDNTRGTNAGAVYVFVRSANSWSQQAKLLAGDSVTGDQLGSSVAIGGDIIVAGAPADDSNSGAAYIFARSGAIWSQQVKLIASDRGTGSLFGTSVSISGDTTLVGANNGDGRVVDSGAAYIFTQNGTTWTQQAKLIASDGTQGDRFAAAVAASEDTAIVGAFADDDKGSASGSAYVFLRSGTAWTQQAKLTASDGVAGDQFGFSVALSGNTAVVGAHQNGMSSTVTRSGSAYVFARSGAAWTLATKLTASDAAKDDFFGRSVAVADDIIVVGSYFDDDRGSSSGSAYVRTGTDWVEQTKLLASDGAAGDQFGHSVAISGDTVVVGSLYDDTSVADTGSAYVYDLNEPPTAEAGGPYSGDKNIAINLDGATASDPEGDLLTYAWVGSESCSFSDSSALNPTLTCTEPGSYTLTLAVTDRYGENATDTGEVTINANVNEAPSKPGVPELTSGTNPNGSGTFTLGWSPSTDPEDAVVMYRLEHKDADDTDFSLVADAITPNSYGVTEAEGTWVYRVKASDGNLESDYSDSSAEVKVDMSAPTAPVASFSVPPVNGWYKGSVTVSYANSTDPILNDGSAGSGVASYSSAQTFSSSGTYAYSGVATDAAGNTSAAVTGSVAVDATVPGVSVSCPATVLLGSSSSATWTASDDESGLVTTASGSVTLDTGTVGSKTATTPTATDNVGYESSASCDYRVIYVFNGFFQPVDNLPTLNSVKAGQAVPVKFSLNGDQGLAIFASDYPKSQAVPCSSTAPVDGIDETVAAGSSSLSYDASTDQYRYVWKTNKAWAGSCRQLIIQFDDGQQQRATFRFER